MALERKSYQLLYSSIFLSMAVYFFWNGAWFDPAVLEVKGSLSSLPARFDVAWDSGSGLNSYERYKVVLNTPSVQPVNKIQISYTGKKNNASLSKTIVCRRIVVDGKELTESRLQLTENRPQIDFMVTADQSIAIELETNNRSGLARITVNGGSYEHDLYIANVEAKSRTYDFWLVGPQKQFTVHTALPRYLTNDLALIKRKGAQSIKLDSIYLLIGEERISLLSQPQMLSQISLGSVSHYQKRFFSWERFLQQLLFAALSTWVVSALFRLYLTCGGLTGIIKGRQQMFLLFFLGAFCCYLVWLLIFWPGMMSVDSLKVWRAAQLPGTYLNDHPILNVFLYSFLYHIWNNPAVVPLFHILATSVLVASIFYTIYRNNVPLVILLPFYLFTVLSIPIGLYNTALWKDIPFALLIVFWGYMAALLFQKKQSQNLNLSWEQVFALFLLLLSLGFIRHNGIIYIVFIPVLLCLLGVIRLDRRIWLGILGIGLLISSGAVFMDSIGTSDSGYFINQGKMYLEGLLSSSPVDLLQRAWRNYWGILDINQTASNWDLYHKFLNDRHAYRFLHHAGWNDVYPFLQSWTGPLAFLKDTAMTIYWNSYKIPLVYLSWNPIWAIVLFPLCVIFCRWLPLSAIFSSVVLVQILTLSTLLNIMNWRYFFFVCVASYFICPMMCFDIARKMKGDRNEV